MENFIVKKSFVSVLRSTDEMCTKGMQSLSPVRDNKY